MYLAFFISITLSKNLKFQWDAEIKKQKKGKYLKDHSENQDRQLLKPKLQRLQKKQKKKALNFKAPACLNPKVYFHLKSIATCRATCQVCPARTPCGKVSLCIPPNVRDVEFHYPRIEH